ncbi:MAG: DUF1489 domain-containing protein [Hyphomicrobiaceae bacterium]|nr:DUF1489 domain-containing protein [Hyphomicrobiaceae bacterium]
MAGDVVGTSIEQGAVSGSVNILKLCVGMDSIEDLGIWQTQCLKLRRKQNLRPLLYHATRKVPKRRTELLNGGSIYWIIRGAIQVRQLITGFEDGQREDGAHNCLIILNPELIVVHPTPRRAFQGWRYLDLCDAPLDMNRMSNNVLEDMPHKMRRELIELCLL